MKTYKLSYKAPDGAARVEWLSSELNATKRRTQLKREFKTVHLDFDHAIEEVEVPTKKDELLKFLNGLCAA